MFREAAVVGRLKGSMPIASPSTEVWVSLAVVELLAALISAAPLYAGGGVEITLYPAACRQ